MNYILCRACGTIFTAPLRQEFAQLVHSLNDHMLDYHFDILGTPAADDVEFKDLDCPDYVWETMMEGVLS